MEPAAIDFPDPVPRRHGLRDLISFAVSVSRVNRGAGSDALEFTREAMEMRLSGSDTDVPVVHLLKVEDVSKWALVDDQLGVPL